MSGRLPPEVIRTRWEDGTLGFGLGAAVGGVIGLVAIQTFAPLPESIFLHAKIWSFGAAHAVGIELGNWQSYSEYMQQLHVSGHPFLIPIRMLVTGLSSIICGCALAWHFGKPRSSLIFHSGARVLRGEEALKAAEKGDGIEIAPGFFFSDKRASKHTLLAGGTGSGKSVVGWSVMLPAKARGDRILLIDFKGFSENWPIKNGDTIMLNPFDRRSKVWAGSKDVKTKQHAKALASMFIVESKDPTWSNAAREILVGCIMKLIKTKGVGGWGWRDLSDLVKLDLADLIDLMKEFHPEGLRTVNSGKPSDSAAFSLSTYMSTINTLADAWENRLDGISIKDWVRNPDSKIRTIILQISTEFADESAAFNAAIVNQVESCLGSMPDVPSHVNPLWLFADEAPKLSKGLVGGWDSFLTVGRSKNLRIIMAIQSRSQLNEMAGDNIASSWIDSIGTKIIGSLDGEGAKWASEMLGETVYLRPTYTTSANGKETIQWSQQAEPAFKPAQIMGELGELEDGTGVRMVLHGFKSRANVKILNTLIKYIPAFESFKQPVELVVDFPFPNIGNKDRSPLRQQTILADFCINPDELKAQRSNPSGSEISATVEQNQVINKNLTSVEIVETKEIIVLDNTQADQPEQAKNELADTLQQELLGHLEQAILNTEIIETALHVAEIGKQIIDINSSESAPVTIEHGNKKRKIIRRKQSAENECETTS